MKCERCTFSTDFSTPTFLERKVGKRALCETSFRFWGSALRGGRDGCSFLLAQKGTKKEPGSVAPTNISPKASVHSRHPWTPFTRVCPFGLCVIPGGQNQDLFLSYSRGIGPYFHENVKGFPSNAHRLVHPYLFGAAVVGWTNCHGYARVGGAISAQYPPNFAYKGPKARGKRYYRTCFRTAGKSMPRNQEGVSRNGGPGGGLTMSASKGAALIGRTPLGASQGELPQRGKRGWPGPLVTFCASRK